MNVSLKTCVVIYRGVIKGASTEIEELIQNGTPKVCLFCALSDA